MEDGRRGIGGRFQRGLLILWFGRFRSGRWITEFVVGIVWEHKGGEIGVLDWGCGCRGSCLEGHDHGWASGGGAGRGSRAREKGGRRAVWKGRFVALLLCAFRAPGFPTWGCRYAAVGGQLSCLFIFSIHGHALAGEDMGEGALVAKLAVALYEPSTDVFLLTRLVYGVREGA